MENVYLKNQNKKECNGCGACALLCPVNAITMVTDIEGFKYPLIDEKKCIKCNKCKRTCSNYNESKNLDESYMVINKNKQELMNSTSGGIFFVLAKQIIENKGIVCGVEYDNNLKVKHNLYDNLDDCKKFRGSKYVGSDLNDIYIKVKKNLNEDKYVLFTGTPCQCQGLKTFLKKDYEKLILCDIMCHSYPSPKVFENYIKECEKEKQSKIINYVHRPKDKGWHYTSSTIEYENGTKSNDKTYFDAFGTGLISRPSCYNCKFSGENRITDLTIGDLWGVEKIVHDYIDDNTGVSFILINSKKGKELFEKIKSNVEYKSVDRKMIFKYNHHESIREHKNRQKFFDNIDNMPVKLNIQKSLKVSIIRKMIRKIKKLIRG